MKHLILPLFASLLLTACAETTDEASTSLPLSAVKGRTVLVYMAAKNSLGPNDYGAYSRSDSLEMVKGRNYLSSNDRLIVFVDDELGAPRLYEVTKKKGFQLLERLPEQTSAVRPNTLKEVLAWTKENAPAEEYGLVMWSHASGWIPSLCNNAVASAKGAVSGGGKSLYSFGIDETISDGKYGLEMDVNELADAIAASGVHLKYIFFDACLMQNLEVGYALKDVTDYLIAAPIATPGAGSNYTDQIKTGLFSTDPSDVARTYFRSVTDPQQWNDYSDFGLTIASVRCDKLQAVADAVRDAAPRSALSSDSLAQNYPDMTGALYYQHYSERYFFRPHNYDALEVYSRTLSAADYARVKALLDEAIAYKASTSRVWMYYDSWQGGDYYQEVDTISPRFSAVSVFVPQAEYTQNASRTPLGDLNVAWEKTRWRMATKGE